MDSECQEEDILGSLMGDYEFDELDSEAEDALLNDDEDYDLEENFGNSEIEVPTKKLKLSLSIENVTNENENSSSELNDDEINLDLEQDDSFLKQKDERESPNLLSGDVADEFSFDRNVSQEDQTFGNDKEDIDDDDDDDEENSRDRFKSERQYIPLSSSSKVVRNIPDSLDQVTLNEESKAQLERENLKKNKSKPKFLNRKVVDNGKRCFQNNNANYQGNSRNSYDNRKFVNKPSQAFNNQNFTPEWSKEEVVSRPRKILINPNFKGSLMAENMDNEFKTHQELARKARLEEQMKFQNDGRVNFHPACRPEPCAFNQQPQPQVVQPFSQQMPQRPPHLINHNMNHNQFVFRNVQPLPHHMNRHQAPPLEIQPPMFQNSWPNRVPEPMIQRPGNMPMMQNIPQHPPPFHRGRPPPPQPMPMYNERHRQSMSPFHERPQGNFWSGQQAPPSFNDGPLNSPMFTGNNQRRNFEQPQQFNNPSPAQVPRPRIPHLMDVSVNAPNKPIPSLLDCVIPNIGKSNKMNQNIRSTFQPKMNNSAKMNIRNRGPINNDCVKSYSKKFTEKSHNIFTNKAIVNVSAANVKSPLPERTSKMKNVGNSNIKQVPIANKEALEKAKEEMKSVEDEDEKTKELREKIEQQKRMREDFLRKKEERRKQQAAERLAALNARMFKNADAASKAGNQNIKKVDISSQNNSGSTDKIVLLKKTPKINSPNDPINRSAVATSKGSVTETSATHSPKRIIRKTAFGPAKVIIGNLASTTPIAKVSKLCLSVGPILKIQQNPQTKNVIAIFKQSNHAKEFLTKYNRYMLDLSVLKVELVGGCS